MSNFANRIAIRVSESEFYNSKINDNSLPDLLKELGYDLSELQFYPNKPYLCTYYKSRYRLLGTTNTPFKDNRTVIEQWNAELFFALASQFSSVGVQVGEYFTDERTGKCYRCTKIDGKWIRDDLQKVALQKHQTHKSTDQELIDFFGILSDIVVIDEPLVKVKQSVKDKITNGVVAHQIAKATNGHHVEDTTIIDGNSLPLVDHPEIVLHVKEEARKLGPMTFKEVLQWFGEGNDVCVGKIDNGEISCKSYAIESVSKHAVQLVDQKALAQFDTIFRSTEEFLRYALQKVD